MFGNVLIAFGDSKMHHGMGIMFGYGLVGFGGMGAFLSSFQFANLFEKQGLPCSILSGLFNASG